MSKKLTIYDLAEALDLSSSTVSTILRGDWQKRRISATTAERVIQYADKIGYHINLTARGLRQSRSGLVGLILPILDNRYFSSMAAAFEECARERGLYPVVSSTQRDPKRELDTIRTLLAHNVEAILIGGAADPDQLSQICKGAGVAHINVDLPGKKASTVLSDNFSGAVHLTQALLSESAKKSRARSEHIFCFLGGTRQDHNTVERVKGFEKTLLAAQIAPERIYFHPSGYEAIDAEGEITALYNEFGRLPDALFVHSTGAFEGVVKFLRNLPLSEIEQCVLGCFDWDPFIELLHFPVFMIRQDVNEMIKQAFLLLDEKDQPGNISSIQTIYVPTQFINYR